MLITHEDIRLEFEDSRKAASVILALLELGQNGASDHQVKRARGPYKKRGKKAIAATKASKAKASEATKGTEEPVDVSNWPQVDTTSWKAIKKAAKQMKFNGNMVSLRSALVRKQGGSKSKLAG